MCGIAGLLTTNTVPDTALRHRVQGMCDALTHRGPDSDGVWANGQGACLGHRRLAIQDLSEFGHQPMQSDDGRYTLAFNGEIYNFHRLRTSLESDGFTFTGHSDTEVLLASIVRDGLEHTVRQCNGMFAIALWDARDSSLSLARDRLGEKPLYYGVRDNTLFWASELKAVFAEFSGFSLEPDAVLEVLRHGYVPAPLCIVRGVRKLLPGHILTIRQSEINGADTLDLEQHAQAFWSVENAVVEGLDQRIEDDDEAAEALESCLLDNLQMQTIADVDLGVFLSGGIDSSLVAALTQSTQQERIRTFTVRFDQPEFDESEHAARIAKHIDSDHTELLVDAAAGEALLPSLPQLFDEPHADASQIPMHLISAQARQHVTVCLSGDGGDELFAGYNRYHMGERYWRRVQAVPAFLRSPLSAGICAVSPQQWDTLYRFGRLLSLGQLPDQAHVGTKAHKIARMMHCRDAKESYDSLLSFWEAGELCPETRSPYSALIDQLPLCYQEKAMAWDQMLYLPGDNLAKVDWAAMATSLEVRLPLLNYELVELSWRLPQRMKFRDGQTKWLLRQILYRHVPRELIERPKMGFSVPVGIWLSGQLKSWAEGLLTDDSLRRHIQIDWDRVMDIWHQHQCGQIDATLKLWSVLTLLSWVHHWQRVLQEP